MGKSSLELKPKGTGEAAQTNQHPAGLSLQTKQAIIGLLSRAQVAQRLGTCPHTVARLTRKGLLPCLRFNSRLIRYKREDVDKFISSALAQ
jgi:excisionase family DNA binding protein